MFDSILPTDINWGELNCFLENNILRISLLSDRWKDSDLIKKANLSINTMMVLECLHDDIVWCFENKFAESRNEEWWLLEKALFSKYGNITERVLHRILSDYYIADR